MDPKVGHAINAFTGEDGVMERHEKKTSITYYT
jgi:hypothetical protein